MYEAAAQSITPPDRTEPKSVYDNTYVSKTGDELLNHIVQNSWVRYPQAYSVHFHPINRADTTYPGSQLNEGLQSVSERPVLPL